MDTETVLHGIYVAAMAAGALLFTVWSGLAYLAMTFDQGKIQIDNQTTHYARYLDWVVTTPFTRMQVGVGMFGHVVYCGSNPTEQIAANILGRHAAAPWMSFGHEHLI